MKKNIFTKNERVYANNIFSYQNVHACVEDCDLSSCNRRLKKTFTQPARRYFTFYRTITHKTVHTRTLGSCDRASWAKCEERENEKDATIRCLLSTSVSTCFGHDYAHLQENKDRVTAYGVLSWFCWMWLVASSARILQRSTPQPLPTTSSRTSSVHHMQ